MYYSLVNHVLHRKKLMSSFRLPPSLSLIFCAEPHGWVFVDPMGRNALSGGVNVGNEDSTQFVGSGDEGRHDRVENDGINMVSLPFTEYSDTVQHDSAALPLAAITPAAEKNSFVHAGSSLPRRSLGFSLSSASQDGVEASWYSSSSKIAVHRPKRLVVPSKFKLSPYITSHSKIKVSSLEADVYDVVLKMAESEYSDLAIVDYGHVVVKLSALGSSLKPQGNVHYFVVNALCKLLFHRKHPKESYKHYFFSKVGDYFIGNHGINDNKEKELNDIVVKCFKGASRARPLQNSTYRRQFVILDSCVLEFGVDSDFHKAVLREFVPNFSFVWRDLVHVDMGFHEYKVIFADVPQQSVNCSNDSGIFAMKYLELWEPSVMLKDKFSESDVSHMRIKFVNDMVFNEYNSGDGRSKVMEYDAEVYEKYFKN